MVKFLLITALVILILCLCVFRPSERISYEKYRTTGGDSFVKLPDGWTNYELSGDPSSAHTVVLIHGGTIPLCIWEAQMDALLGAGFRILRYDQFGRGFSDRPDAVFSRDLFLRQLKGLLDTLRITMPVTLIGPSFGGAISVNFAARYPERVRSLILISPVLNLLNSDSPLAGPIKTLRTPLIGEILYKLFLRSKIIARGRALVPGGKYSPCDTAFLNQWKCKGTQRGMFSMFRSDAYGDYRELTRQMGKAVPHLLLLRGKKDREVTERMIDEVKVDLPAAEFVEIENSGHNPCTDAAEVFNKIVVDYVKGR